MRVAIYDGKCGMCRSLARALRKHVPPTELDVVPCGSEIQKKLAPCVAAELCAKTFTLVDEDGSIHVGGDAVLRAVTLSPALEKYRPYAEKLAVRTAANVVYKGVSMLRTRDADDTGEN